MTDRRRNLFILLIVAGLLLASAILIVQKKTRLGLDLKGGVQLVYQAKPTPQQPVVDSAAIDRSIEIMRKRVDQLGVAEPEIQRAGANQIEVGLPDVKNAQRAIKTVGTTAQLFFYDWEANVVGPNGKPQPANLAVTGGTSAGATGAGSLPYYDAVIRAAKVPPKPQNNVSAGDQYYLVNDKLRQVVRGPEDTARNLFSEIPRRAGQRVVKLNRGTTTVQAEAPSKTPKNFVPQYYVLNDNVALRGTDIKNPKQDFNSGGGGNGSPIVTFSFTKHGRKQWQNVTRAIAQRGAERLPQVQLENPNVGLQQQRDLANQHFAAVLDNKLITVPFISFVDNPDGIDGINGSQIEGGFTIQSAQDLANLLELGALPIKLDLISQSQVSATLGKQALHQGLIAGAVGLALVALFLLVFYRVLGLIAVGGLIVYGLYFFGLIKLIPITLTLPGIAGLILTIGVAADANIVIFERVKEEVRSGRSIPSAIAAGYKKGFSAILDANVVTIMTAFILFILATAGVKGFAFTLGVGTIVSLFTAVLATQAILGTMSRSRLIAHPTALGVTEKKRRWSFDFMGSSKWFFSMSGTILLIGALSIGAKGLKFGIDFESGTRITTALVKPTNENGVRSVLSAAGYPDAKIQRVNDPKQGQNVFQISTRTLQPNKVTQVTTDLQTKYGLVRAPDTQSIGPTFGQTVANSAVTAIIASLIVITLYIALRFEWKYAVPVLIALMHDLLITAGVYSLTGREVTTSTVAALLTILGYSLYDTIIVFDRIRENVPRMPRAAFSQIVNRSMSEVLTRSLATTLCTLLPVTSLLLFGGQTLKDFAFALLVGVASGAYSSIFIASPVLTHWKERETVYARRTGRIRRESGGIVPAYAVATVGGAPVDVVPAEPVGVASASRRVTAPEEPSEVSKAEFDAMVRDLHDDGGRADPAADLDPDDPGAVAPIPGRAARPAKPKRDKQKKPRNRRHGRAR